MKALLISRSNGIVVITFNRPASRNALSLQLLSELAESLLADNLVGASAIVIDGAGETFSAGADISELTGTSRDVVIDDSIGAAVLAIKNTRIPVIASITGPCIGAAVDIALACDIRVASGDSYFQVPAVRLGLLYNPAGVARMHAELSREVLDRVLVRGEKIAASAAFACGLLTHTPLGVKSGGVHPAAQKDSSVQGIAATSTIKLLDDLDAKRFDPEYWERVRREILNSPERAAAVQAAQRKHIQ